MRRMQSEDQGLRIRRFIIFAIVYLAVLVLTDLYRGRASGDYLRGWARAIVFVANALGFITIARLKPQHLRTAVVAASVGLLVMTLATEGFNSTTWKFGIGTPANLIVFALIDSRRIKLATGTALSLCLLHLLLDFRSAAAFCLVVAVLVQLTNKRERSRGRIEWKGPALLALASGVLFVLVYISNSSLIPSAADIATRRGDSNVERIAGLAVGAQAISAHPIVGMGSWPRSEDLLVRWANMQEEMGAERTASSLITRALEREEQDIIRTHSQLLQAWVEAGIVGFLFFAFLFFQIARMFARLILKSPMPREFLLVAFQAMWSLWAIPFSPFAGTERLTLALSLALLFCYARLPNAMSDLADLQPANR